MLISGVKRFARSCPFVIGSHLDNDGASSHTYGGYCDRNNWRIMRGVTQQVMNKRRA